MTLLLASALALTCAPQESVAVFSGLAGEVARRPVAELDGGARLPEGAVFAHFEGLAEPVLSAPAERAEVDLADGSRLAGRLCGGAEEELWLELLPGQQARLDLVGLAGLVVPGRLDPESAPPEAAEEGDRLYRKVPRGVDQVDGLLVELGPDALVFESRVGARTYPWSEVVALFVEALEEPAPPAVDGPPVRVDLYGGGRLAGRLAGLSSQGLRVVSVAGELELPLALVREVAVEDGSYAFLSALPPSAAPPSAPFDPEGAEPLGMVWPARMDRAVGDRPLRVGGRAWTRGIGVHAPSRVRWELDGSWRELRLSVGIDDQVLEGQGRGSVRFHVLVDGEERWVSPIVRGGEAPLAAPHVALVGARALELVVDDAGDGPELDRADWLRPLLVRG